MIGKRTTGDVVAGQGAPMKIGEQSIVGAACLDAAAADYGQQVSQISRYLSSRSTKAWS